MGMRSKVGSAIDRALGPDRARTVRRTEARARMRLIRALDVEGRTAKSRKPARPAAKQAKRPRTREQLIEELGRATPEGLGAGSTLPDGLTWATPDPYPDFRRPSADYLEVLAGLHGRLRPRTYVEIGVSMGESLTLAHAKTIAVDPAYRIVRPVNCDLAASVETSDAFFARPDAFDHFGGLPVDFAFIDGMHLAEYALRDFMNMEKHMSPGGVIALDDMLPRNAIEAFRIRRTKAWAGDVFKVHRVLCEYRPDLTLVPINSGPTGSYLVLGVDPTNTVLDEAYQSLLPLLSSPDPQTVEPQWCERRECRDALEVLASPAWDEVVKLRDAGAGREQFTDLWQQIASVPTLADAH